MLQILTLIVLAWLVGVSHAVEFKARIIDGLGQPVLDATVNIELKEKNDGKVTQVHRLKLLSDRDGLVVGRYDEKKFSKDDVWVSISKSGYESYSTGLGAEYGLKRNFGPKDVRRIARLNGEVQTSEIRDLLAGEFESHGVESLEFSVFLYYREFGPGLRILLTDPKVGTTAATLLSFVGVPDDLRRVVQHASPPKRKPFEDPWVYMVVTSLLEPATDAEWGFLRKCALNEYDDLWVDAGAIQTLRLIASARSVGILQEVAKRNSNRKEMIGRAIKYIQSSPPSLSGKVLTNAGTAVAQALRIGNWEGNSEPRLNDEGDMALIDCEFTAGRDRLTYTATFHHVDGIWKLRGVRETLQALMANPPDRNVFLGVWHGYSDSHLEFARIELKEDGTGLFALSELPDAPLYTYRITKWSQRGFQLDIILDPVEPEAELIVLKKVHYGTEALDLEVHGSDWSRKMTLMNENEFQNRANAAKKSLEQSKFKLKQ